MIAKTRCKPFDCNEKPATNSAGATVAPRASPVSADADQDKRLVRRNGDPEHHDPGREERHADERQVVHGTPGNDNAKHDRHDDGTAEFGQIQQPHPDRIEGLQQHVGRQRRRRDRRSRGEQRDTDARDGDRTGQHGANRQQRTASLELVDDQHNDQRQTTQHRRRHRRIPEAVARQLRSADERGRAADGRQSDGKQVTRGVEIGRRGVVKSQRGQHQSQSARPRRRSRTAVAMHAPKPAPLR